MKFDTPHPPHNQTATSKAAAEAIAPKAGTLRATILDFVRRQGVTGATAHEIQQCLGLSGDTVRPRLWELRGHSSKTPMPVLLEASGETRKSPSGRASVVYRAVTG